MNLKPEPPEVQPVEPPEVQPVEPPEVQPVEPQAPERKMKMTSLRRADALPM
jgi:hypothetical protein